MKIFRKMFIWNNQKDSRLVMVSILFVNLDIHIWTLCWHTSRQWYLKLYVVISLPGFVEDIMDQCIYHKVSGSKTCFLVSYVDDIWLSTNDMGLLHEVKQSSLTNLIWKIWVKRLIWSDLRYIWIYLKVSWDFLRKPISIKFLRDFEWKIVHKVWQQLWSWHVQFEPMPQKWVWREEMQNIPYASIVGASIVGSLMYAQVCIRPAIAIAGGMLEISE